MAREHYIEHWDGGHTFGHLLPVNYESQVYLIWGWYEANKYNNQIEVTIRSERTNAQKITHGRPHATKQRKSAACRGGDEGWWYEEELRRSKTTVIDRGENGETEAERGIWWKKEGAIAHTWMINRTSKTLSTVYNTSKGKQQAMQPMWCALSRISGLRSYTEAWLGWGLCWPLGNLRTNPSPTPIWKMLWVNWCRWCGLLCRCKQKHNFHCHGTHFLTIMPHTTHIYVGQIEEDPDVIVPTYCT